MVIATTDGRCRSGRPRLRASRPWAGWRCSRTCPRGGNGGRLAEDESAWRLGTLRIEGDLVEVEQGGDRRRSLGPGDVDAQTGVGAKRERRVLTDVWPVEPKAIGLVEDIRIAVRSGERDDDGVAGADLVITDTWAGMGQEEEKAQRLAALTDFQVNENLMAIASQEALFMHCLPAYRGQEVSAEVLEGPQSVIWDEAENRLHAQKALIELLIG